MPKKSRSSHIPQQVTRKRRTLRRPDFQPEPETLNEAAPQFADPAGVGIPGFGGAGPVETRPQWREPQESRGANRRRLEQLRRSSEGTGLRALAGQLPTYERAYLISEIRRIAITSSILLAVIIALTLILR